MFYVFIALLLASFFSILLYFRKIYSHFEKVKIPCASYVPFFGSLWRSSLRNVNILYEVDDIYRNVGDKSSRYVGFYQFTSPVILLKDLDLIKRITISNFDGFENHRYFINKDFGDLFSRNIFAMTGQKWRNMRGVLSPIFTAAKVKGMFNGIWQSGEDLNAYIEEKKLEAEEKGKVGMEHSILYLTTRYMSNAIASAAFGWRINSFQDLKCDFFTIGLEVGKTTLKLFVKIMVMVWLPPIAKILKLKFLEERVERYYRAIIKENISYREKQNIVKDDMINRLMQARKDWSEEDDLTAQAVVLSLAAVDTISSPGSLCLGELAINQDIQKTLQEEIDRTLREHNDKPDFAAVNDMKYLEMVVSEILRRWPPVSHTDRVSNNNRFELGPVIPGDSNSYKVKDGDLFWIPISAIHNDPKYWENPQKFNPDRFSDKNKKNIVPGSYLPYGIGPRKCFASKYASISLKVFLFQILKSYNIELASNTKVPLELDRTAIVSRMDYVQELKFLRRNQ